MKRPYFLEQIISITLSLYVHADSLLNVGLDFEFYVTRKCFYKSFPIIKPGWNETCIESMWLFTTLTFSGQLQKSVDVLGGGLTKIYCQVVYEERNKVCTFAT